MAAPRCPNPAHAGSKVSRAGWYGTAPHRRQRWQCRPRNGERAHRFAEPLPRQEAQACYCGDCSSALEPWQGQAGARKYAYNARDVAHGLALVADGESYRRAAAKARTFARRQRGSVGYYYHHGVRRVRRGDRDGQLVANWVDVFAQVVCFEHGVSRWPERVAVDAVSWVIQPGRPRRSLHLLVAVGYDPPSYQPRLWLVRPFATKDQAAWEDFFNLLDGTPKHIIADMDGAIEAAVAQCFPRRGDPPPGYRWSDHHVKQALANVLSPLPDGHPLLDGLDSALNSQRRWDGFVHAIEAEHRRNQTLPASPNWLAQFGPRIRQQTINRVAQQAHSTGAVEAVNAWLKRKLGDRVRHLGNRRRTVKLLDLLTLGYNHHADERAFAVAIRKYLEGHYGRPQLTQRQLDDLKSTPSLYT